MIVGRLIHGFAGVSRLSSSMAVRIHPIGSFGDLYYERLPKGLVRSTRRFVEPTYALARRLVDIVRDFYLATSVVDAGIGAAGDPPLRFTVAGRGDTRGFFFQRLCGNAPPSEARGRTPIWKVRAAGDGNAAAVLVEADRCFGRLLARWGFVAIPEWVLFTVDLSAPWPEIERSWRRHIRDNLRLVRKYGYQCEMSTDLDRLRYFYDRMFLPHIGTRYGEGAVDVSFGYMQSLLDRGVLLMIRSGGEDVAGFLIRTTPVARPMVAFMGIKEADPLLLKRGVTAALYYYCMRWAKEQGYRSLDFGHTRPFLRDGLLLWKKRWGLQMQRSDRKFRSLYVSLDGHHAGLERFLADNPLVCEDRGRLRALLYRPERVVAAEAERPYERECDVAGLDGVRTEWFGAGR
jgi:hypothetical protein